MTPVSDTWTWVQIIGCFWVLTGGRLRHSYPSPSAHRQTANRCHLCFLVSGFHPGWTIRSFPIRSHSKAAKGWQELNDLFFTKKQKCRARITAQAFSKAKKIKKKKKNLFHISQRLELHTEKGVGLQESACVIWTPSCIFLWVEEEICRNRESKGTD